MRYGGIVEEGFLPAFSVNTEDEARRLLTLACPINIEGAFIARELTHEQTLSNLEVFGDRLALAYAFMKKRDDEGATSMETLTNAILTTVHDER